MTAGDLGTVHNALKGVMKSLQQWSAVKFGSVRKKFEELRATLATLRAAGEDGLEVKETIREMNELLYREEGLCLQRSRVS